MTMGEERAYLRQIAQAVFTGSPIGVRIIASALGVTERDAQRLLAMDWGAEVRALEAEASHAAALRCRDCGEEFYNAPAKASHERGCLAPVPPLPVLNLPPPPDRCPRCKGELILNHGERICLVHGEVYAPVTAMDRKGGGFGYVGPDEELPDRRRRRGAHRMVGVSA